MTTQTIFWIIYAIIGTILFLVSRNISRIADTWKRKEILSTLFLSLIWPVWLTLALWVHYKQRRLYRKQSR